MLRIRGSNIFNISRVRDRIVQTAKGQLRQMLVSDGHEEISALRFARTGTAIQHGPRRRRGVCAHNDCVDIACGAVVFNSNISCSGESFDAWN